MRRIQKIMAGIFLGGVLLGGIGMGIAVVEFSGLSYGGERLLGEEYLVTKDLDFDFVQDGRVLILENSWYFRSTGGKIETDETVPVGTVRYQVTYNEKRLTPELMFYEYEEETYEKEPDEREPVYLGSLRLNVWHHDDPLAFFMENKDYFLEELKQRKIFSYQQVYITKITVKVNPKTRPYIQTWSNY